MSNPVEQHHDPAEGTNPNLQAIAGGGGGFRPTLQNISAILSIIGVLLGGSYGVFTVWTQAQAAYEQSRENQKAINQLRQEVLPKMKEELKTDIGGVKTSLGRVQVDMATVCVAVTKDVRACKTTGGVSNP